MTEYIDREALSAWLHETMSVQTTTVGMAYVRDFWNKVLSVPAADVVEAKHGRWVMKETMIRSPYAKNAYCSECLEETARAYKYCPNCGAKMERGTDCN